MSGRLRHLRHLYQWCDEWCDPIVNAMYREDLADCKLLLQHARTEASAPTYSPDDAQALGYQLDFLEFQAACNLGQPSEQQRRAAWDHLLERLAAPPCGEMSALLQNCLLLIARTLGHGRGHLFLTQPMMDEMFCRISPKDLDAEIWYYVANWALETRNSHYIALAYEEMLTEPSGYLRHDVWLRINLMYLLTEGRAAERDVIETFRVHTHPNQLRRFEEYFWPALIEAGLDTPAIREALQAKRAELAGKPLKQPF